MVAMADPYLGQWTYQRDYAGRLRVQTDARGDVFKLYYVNPSTGQQDPLGRVQTKQVYSLNYSNHTLTLVSTVTNIYDSSDDGNYTVYPGLLYKTTDSEGWEKNGYDTRGRLIKTTRYLNINQLILTPPATPIMTATTSRPLPIQTAGRSSPIPISTAGASTQVSRSGGSIITIRSAPEAMMSSGT